MNSTDEQRHIKAIRHLQRRADAIEEAHNAIGSDICAIGKRLAELVDIDKSTPDFAKRKQAQLDEMSARKDLPAVDVETIYSESEADFPEVASLDRDLSDRRPSSDSRGRGLPSPAHIQLSTVRPSNARKSFAFDVTRTSPFAWAIAAI